MLNEYGRNSGEPLRLAVEIKGIYVPPRSMLSWEHTFQDVPAERVKTMIVRHRGVGVFTTKALGSPNGLIVRIEGSDPRDVQEAIEMMVLYAGGEVQTFRPGTVGSNSFVQGVRNDFVYAWQIFKLWARAVRQWLGFRIAA